MTADQPASGTDRSRRSFVKHGALASGALALGLPSAAAQDGGNGTDGNGTAGNATGGGNGTAGGDDAPPPGDALMFNDEFRPGAQFRVISGVVSETPQLATEGRILGRYDGYIVEYLNTREQVLLFPDEDTDVQQGGIYEFSDTFELVEREATGAGIVAVTFQTVPDDEVLVSPDFSIDDYETVPGGGKALVRTDNVNTGALVRIVSGVVEWTPPPDVAGTDVLSEYNTRHARYLNTGDEFLIFPAHEAEIEEGAVYAMLEEFDVTAPEGNLVTVDLARLSEESTQEILG